MASIAIKKDLPDEFLSNILITAFDGAYGASWNWFEGVNVGPIVKVDEERSLWLSAHVRLRRDEDGEYLTGNPVYDNPEGFIIDYDSLAGAMTRIIEDDYLGIWRPANEREIEEWKNNGTPRGRHYQLTPGVGLIVETGETARDYQEPLKEILSGDLDAGDIDAGFADAIVQVAAFGKVIFS